MPPRVDLQPARPLTEDERDQLCGVLRRLRAEVRAAIARLPKDVSGPSGVARHLGVDKATAHRVLALGTGASDDPDRLAQVPGDAGLRRFAEACRESGMDEGVVAGLEAAAEQFGRVIRDLAGSKNRLLARVRASGPPEGTRRPHLDASDESRRRESLYRAASEMVGRSTEVRVDLMIFRPSEEREGWLDHTWVRGIFGHISRPGASPISLGFVVRADRTGKEPDAALYETLDADALIGRTPRAVLSEFSTHPVPIITSRGQGNRVNLVVDPDASATERGVDVVVAQHRRAIGLDPSAEQPPVLELNAMVREPTRTLVFDVYLHREMARRAIPQLDLYLWSPGLEQSLADVWFDAIETTTPLQILGPGLRRAASASFARQDELTRAVFTKLRYDPDEFVGFRCEVAYPMWGGAYAMTFDFGETHRG